MPFTKQSVNALHKQALEDLVELAKERGLDIKMAGGTFDAGRATLKFEFTDLGASMDLDREQFVQYAKYVGLKAEDYGRTFNHKGKRFKIVCLKVGNKYDVGALPVQASIDQPRTFFQSAYIQRALGSN